MRTTSWSTGLATVMVAMLAAGTATAQTISVDLGVELQTIEGFGGFGPAKVWWDAGPWHDAAYLDLIVDDLGSTIVRTQLYWDGEPSNDDDDPRTFNWEGFDFGPESDNGKQFDFVRDLDARGDVKLIASVWTPPIWMKQNSDDSLAVFCRGQCGGNLNATLHDEFAEYLAAYVITMKERTGVDLWALSIQNELIFANPFESCVYDADQYAEVLKVVGARFASEGLSTRLFGPEHMGSFDWNTSTSLFSEILDDPDAAQYLDAYAVHGYLDGVNADDYDPAGWEAMHERVSTAGKQLWMTETSDGGNETTWSGAWAMAKHLHAALKYGRINAWVYWYFAGNIVEDDQGLPLYHLFKGWYRNVRPGFVQVGSAADDAELLVTAFRGDDHLTVVVMNDGSAEKTASLQVSGGAVPTAYQGFRAGEAVGFTELGEVGAADVVFPPQTITTLVFVGSGGLPSTGGLGGAGSVGTGGASAGDGPTVARGAGDDGGCGCRATGPAPTVAHWLALLAALGLARRRSR